MRQHIECKGRLGSLGDSLRALVQKSQAEQAALRQAQPATPVNAASVHMMAHALSLPEADHLEVARFEDEGNTCCADGIEG